MIDNCNNKDKRSDCETQIYNSILQLNKDFTTYQSAYNKCYSQNNINTCLNKDKENKELITATININTDIQQFDKYINEYKTTFLNKDKLMDNKTASPAGTDVFYKDIIDQYNQLFKKRQNIDAQLYELYANDSESMYSINPTMESTVLTGIIWTFLATSIIYFVILKY
jgi:hypothetical protein